MLDAMDYFKNEKIDSCQFQDYFGYTSPIEAISTEMRMVYEEEAIKAVHKIGFDIDKEELTKALAYDRDQYNKGFADAKGLMLNWIAERKKAYSTVLFGWHGYNLLEELESDIKRL